jgi:predicted  nucleic acid-binding Zn-ribbon protein
MTLQEFIDKYNGKSIDWDLAYGGQCVDLFRQYCHEVLGISQPKSVTGAADFWSNYDTDSVLNQNFTKIANSTEFVPQAGDVGIWNRRAGGGYGHIAVCTGKGDTNSFESFDQNWSRVSFCELVNHNYTNFYGVLRFNKVMVEKLYRGYDLSNLDSMKIAVDDHIKVAEGQLVDKSQYEAIKGQLTESQKRVEELSSQLGTANATIKALTDKVESQTTIIAEYNKEDAVQISQLKEAQTKLGELSVTHWGLLNHLASELKVSVGSESAEELTSRLTGALQGQIQMLALYENKVKDLEKKLSVINTQKLPIAKLTNKDLFFIIISRLLKRS